MHTVCATAGSAWPCGIGITDINIQSMLACTQYQCDQHCQAAPVYFDSSMCRLHILYRISTVRVKSAWPDVAPRVPDNPKSWHCYDALPSDIISHEISKRVPAQHHDMGKKTTGCCHNDYYCQKSQAVFAACAKHCINAMYTCGTVQK